MAYETTKGGTDGVPIVVQTVGGASAQVIRHDFGVEDEVRPVTEADGLPVQGPLTDAQLRALAVNVTVSNPSANPETGLATEATQLLVLAALQAFSVDGGAP